MSVVALLQGVESRLKTFLSDDGRLVGVQEDGRPPPSAGQLYYAVWWPGSRGDDHNPQSHDVLHAVTVTLTGRFALAPRDRRGAKLVAAGELIAAAEAVAGPGVIHGSWDTIALVNGFITGAGVTTNGFAEPLVLLDYGPVAEQGPEWVGAEKTTGGIYSVDVRFGMARRVQVLY